MARKPQTPHWLRLARTARVEASKLPIGSARDALVVKARKLEAAGKRDALQYALPDRFVAIPGGSRPAS